MKNELDQFEEQGIISVLCSVTEIRLHFLSKIMDYSPGHKVVRGRGGGRTHAHTYTYSYTYHPFQFLFHIVYIVQFYSIVSYTILYTILVSYSCMLLIRSFVHVVLSHLQMIFILMWYADRVSFRSWEPTHQSYQKNKEKILFLSKQSSIYLSKIVFNRNLTRSSHNKRD